VHKHEKLIKVILKKEKKQNIKLTFTTKWPGSTDNSAARRNCIYAKKKSRRK
jgi:hypothetical protein